MPWLLIALLLFLALEGLLANRFYRKPDSSLRETIDQRETIKREPKDVLTEAR
jgi:hypothetical protein